MVSIITIIFVVGMLFDVVRHPECYSTRYKYQLHNDIKAGNKSAIDYYNSNYVSQGIVLYDDINNSSLLARR
jgi:hypothetical protein